MQVVKSHLIENYLWIPLTFSQGRSQTSEQDEASFERRRRQPLRGLGACPPPLLPRKFWNLQPQKQGGWRFIRPAQKCSCNHFPWHFFFFRKVNLGQVSKFTFLLLSDAGAKLMTICISKHSNVVTRIIKIKWIHESTQRLWILYCRLIKRSFR